MNRLILLLLLFSLFCSCEKDSEDSTSNPTSSISGFPAKKNQQIQGIINGKNFNVKSIRAYYYYFNEALGAEVSDIQSIKIELLDSNMNNPCANFRNPILSPYLSINIPPTVSSHKLSNDFFNAPILNIYEPYSMGIHSISYSNRTGYVEVEKLDTNGRGKATLYIYCSYETETFDVNGNFMDSYKNLIEGRIEVNNCKQNGRFEFLDQPMQGTVKGVPWTLNHGFTQRFFSNQLKVLFFGEVGDDTCGSNPNQFPRFEVNLIDTLGLLKYGTSNSPYRLSCTYDTTSAFNANNVNCGILITDIDTINKRLLGIADIFSSSNQVSISINGKFDIPYCD